jgi:hypothetical protein
LSRILAVPPGPFHPQNFLTAVDQALPDCIHVAGHLPNIPAIWIFRVRKKRPLPAEPSQLDADEEFLFRFCVNRRVLRASLDSVAAGRDGVFVAKNVSIRSIVKKKRRKPQTSQDKAVATNDHSGQTSGKNQNREFFTVFSRRVVLRILKVGFGFFPALQNERQNPRGILSHTRCRGCIRTLLPLTERTPLPNPLPTSWGEGIGRSHGRSVRMRPVVAAGPQLALLPGPIGYNSTRSE